jgi:hypothetical protein
MTTPTPTGTTPHPIGAPPAPPAPYRGTSTLAILALVLSFVVPPGGIVLGALALREIDRTGEEGRGLALAGLWLGIAFTAIIALFILVWIGMFVWILSIFGTIASTVPATIPNA